VKPPIPYFGGKMTVGPVIAALLPSHGHYVEPYCGSLAVLLAKSPSAHETVNDLDGDVVNFWRVLRERPDDLERQCALTPHSRAEQLASYDLTGCDDLERARRLFVQLTQGRSGIRRKTGWRHYIKPCRDSGSGSMPHYLRGYVTRIAAVSERLQSVSLECLPALDIIAKYGRDPDVLLYVDPPYLGTTRGWDKGYVHEMPGEADHRELAQALHATLATVVLSGYASNLYDRELYPGWDRHTIATSTGQGGKWDARTEVLWSNRPLGVHPQLELWESA
jgi:DNA adenine methylase